METIAQNSFECHKEHADAKYIKHMKIVNQNIVHVWVETEYGTEIDLEHMDIDLLQSLLPKIQSPDKKLHILYNLTNIKSITYNYKYAITKLLFHLSPSIGVIAFYNISPSVNAIIQIFEAITPKGIIILQEKTYDDALTKIMQYNDGKPPTSSHAMLNNNDAQYIRCFLEGCARLSWLNIYDQPITIPPEGHPLQLLFQAFDSLREDLIVKEKTQGIEIARLRQEADRAIQDKIIVLKAKQELYAKKIQEKEEEIATLAKQIAHQENVKSYSIDHQKKHRKEIASLLSLINSLDINDSAKEKLQAACNKILKDEKELYNKISEVDKFYIQRVKEKFPILSDKELHTCLLITKNFNSKEIALEMGIAERGVETFRYRIHKKLTLPKNQSLKNYLLSLTL
uniref:Response regulator receiver domain protein (CheY-like) n=1 Tax=Chlorobium chlorochromatii (strain CaD3) TaxID=340177 RepID=Q3AU31_CHLCH